MTTTDFSTITACGECCVECKKKLSGECPGCIEADGAVPEWKESGRCKIHTCVREHGVQFCGLCREFPCNKIPKLFFVKHFSLKRASEFPVFVKGISLLSAGHSYASRRMRACSIR